MTQDELNEIKKELTECGVDAVWGFDIPEDFVLREDSGWEDEGKYQLKHAVYEHIPTGTYWMACGSRSGDHWGGYENSLDSVEQVRPVEKVITTWEGM